MSATSLADPAKPRDSGKTAKFSRRAAAPAAIKASGSDEALVRHLMQLKEATAGEQIVWLHLSRVDGAARAGKHVQAVTKALAEVAKRLDGRLFMLHGGDMAVCCRGVGRHAIDETIELLHYLFDGLPNVPRDARQSGLWSVFDSKADHAALSAALLAVQAEIRARLEAREHGSAPRRRRRAISTRPLAARTRIALLAALLLAVAATIIAAGRSQSSVWVFDSPDAQRPHLLRNSWTGDYSR